MRTEDPPPILFQFKGRDDFDVMNELLRYEELAHHVYSSVRSAIGKQSLEQCVPAEKRERFISILDSLIADEAHHKEMVRGQVGHIEKIR